MIITTKNSLMQFGLTFETVFDIFNLAKNTRPALHGGFLYFFIGELNV
jgi:hypothetical protein